MEFYGNLVKTNAQSEFDRQVAKWEQQANLLQKELAAIKERLDKQMLMLSDEKKRELEAEYAKKETELKDFISRVYGRSGELLSENEKVSAPIIQLIRKAVNEIALQEGYDMVVDRATGSVLFWKNENDLTQKVLDYLNSR
ncbi:MAG: OmpH family outer membrane protein [Fibrobacteraceae bacterium]|nr:OmpH family outer membrane protein [Fibrobacteraceae bacterium]